MPEKDGQGRHEQRESVETFATMYRAKVFGTIALGELLADRPDAPLVLFSSVNAEFGGSSFGAYYLGQQLPGRGSPTTGPTSAAVRCTAWLGACGRTQG